MCEECTGPRGNRQPAEWLIVTPDVEWIGRVCSDHLQGAGMDPRAQVYARETA